MVSGGVGHWPGESSEVWIRCYASQTCIFTFINIPHATKDCSSLVDSYILTLENSFLNTVVLFLIKYWFVGLEREQYAMNVTETKTLIQF